MNLLCCCPTYRRPVHLLNNTVQCFLDQTPMKGHEYTLILLDDGGTYKEQHEGNWHLITEATRSPSLPQKYPKILGYAEEMGIDWDVFVVWDDDDIYLPDHLKNHILTLENHLWSYPSQVWSTYKPPLIRESSGGRFWGSIAVDRYLYERVGGVPQVDTPDFDQLFLQNLHKDSPAGDPLAFGEPTYIYRWSDTGATHAQHSQKGPKDLDWYKRHTPPVKPQPRITPQYDERARATLQVQRA